MKRKDRSAAGYTLTEVMIAITVSLLISGGVSLFFLHGLSTSFMTAGKLKISNDIRKFTNELTAEARNATYFEVHAGLGDTAEPMRDNNPGDMIVLYYLDRQGDAERIIGYYRAAGEGEEGPVRKFTLEATGGGMPSLPDISLMDEFPIVLELSRGLADGRLFYNFYDRSVLVRGEVIHQGNLIRRATNTYNFTVSPRG